MSFRTKLMLSIVGTFLVFTIALFAFVRPRLSAMLTEEHIDQGIAIARNVAALSADASLTNSRLSAQLRHVQAGYPDIAYIFAVGPRREVIAHTFGGEFPEHLLQERPVGPPRAHAVELPDRGKITVLDIVAPIGDTGGYVRIGTSTRHLSRLIAGAMRVIELIAAAALAIGLILVYFQTRLLTGPVARLGRAAEAIGRGDLDQEIPVETKDEIGALATSFNRMIRDLKESRDELIRANRQVQQIVDTVPEGVLLLDAERRIVLVNPTAREYLSVLADGGVGDMLTHLSGRSVAELLEPPLEGSHHEVVVEDPSRRVFEVEARSVETGPQTGGWVLVLHDVTEEREVQGRVQEHQRLAAVGQLAAGIAHDFNNLLTGVIGYAQLLQMRHDVPESAKNDLKRIVEQGNRAAHLIRQILDFSRKSIIQRQPLDLVPFLKEAIKFLERTIPESIHIVPEMDPGAYIVNADPTQIQQVVTNLAVNARDAMPEGGELRFRLSRLTLKPGERPPFPDMEPGEWIVLSASDTGVGIPPDVLLHLYEPFFTTKEVGKGTGLGLAQVYGIVMQHDGFIDVESGVEEGTTFVIYLPAAGVGKEVPREKAPEELPRGRGETILVVEDEPDVLDMIGRMLEGLGYQVMTAANGPEALKVYDQHREEIALVLTDMVMPEMGGVELFYVLRDQNSGVKVVVITGYALGEEEEDVLSQGIVAWVQKPADLAQLAQVVRRALKATSRVLSRTAEGPEPERVEV